MADGWVYSCNRTIDDNTPPTRGEKGGNSVVVVHAPEEFVLYAHFKKADGAKRRVPTQRKRVHAECNPREGGSETRPCRQLWPLHRSAPARPRRQQCRRRLPGPHASFRNVR